MSVHDLILNHAQEIGDFNDENFKSYKPETHSKPLVLEDNFIPTKTSDFEEAKDFIVENEEVKLEIAGSSR
jgi:hypothetical protein